MSTATAPADATSPSQAARRSRLLVIVLVGLVVGALVGLLPGVRGPRLGPATTGDAALAADVRAALADDRGFQSLSAVRVRDGQVTFAGLGEAAGGPPTSETRFELGSITKTFTGALLADAVRRGEMRLDEPVATYLPELRDTPVGASTLRQLATHTAGLPPFPDDMSLGVMLRVLANENTADTRSVAGMLDAARGTEVGERGRYRYSNLGVSLLGHAEARAAGAADWPTLVQARIFDPLGMGDTVIAVEEAQVPTDVAAPHRINGWPAPVWWGAAFAPAGAATITTPADVATWALAVLEGRAPGAEALEPLERSSQGSVGLLWQLREAQGRTITWHNGGTGGTRTMLALDRERGQAVLLVSNSGRDADLAGLTMAATAAGTVPPPVDRVEVGWRSALGWSVVGLVLLATAVLRLRAPRSWLTVFDGAAAGAVGLLTLLVHGPWHVVPLLVWTALVGGTVALVAWAVLTRARPGPAEVVPKGAVRTSVLSLVSTAVVLALVVWTM